MRRSNLCFWDVDGVFSIPTPETRTQWVKFGYGLPAWVTPTAFALLRAVDADPHRHNVWLSAWGTDAVLWNQRAGTRVWPVAYHLTCRQLQYAKKVLPAPLFADPRIDGKLIAVHYYLWRRRYPESGHVLWVEDGFAEETRAWASARGNVSLIDTSEDPLRATLLNAELPVEDAMAHFLDAPQKHSIT